MRYLLVLLLLVLVSLVAGCGSKVAPTAPPAPSQIHSVGDADGGALKVPPVKAENYLAPEPDDVELGPRG